MRELLPPKAEVFLDALQAALGGPGRRSQEVLAEVRSNLEAAVAHAMEQGLEEQAAWEAALEDLGDPEELADAMRAPLPPEAPPAWVVTARFAAAVLLIGWTAVVGWEVRSWDYDNRFGLFSAMVCLHLPFALLLWPGIVWRWNALFSTTTAVAVVVLAWFAAFGASRTEVVYELSEVPLTTIEETVGPQTQPESAARQASPLALVTRETWAALAALAFACLVLTLVQQGKQRRRILLFAGGLLLALDLPHTIEERLFVREVRSVAAWVESERERTGLLPTEAQFARDYAPLLIDDLSYSKSETTFSLHWSRATQGSSELGYHSEGTFWGND